MPKKTIKKNTTPRKNIKPVAAHAPELHECHCGCSCTPLKKTIILTCMFLLGFAVAKFAFCSCHRCEHKMHKSHPVFVNGCLDMQSVKCPKMQEMLANADVDGDGCINVTEFNSVKRVMRREQRKSEQE